MDEPQISIICNTYNQEKYIAEALESFLMQRVNVPFEILVHDDASTDGTADVIRKYEKKYPDIIKPIYQTQNQWNLDVSVTASIQIPRAKGKYIAFCEGDDYWTDPDKLQIQYDYMETYNECSICCHAYNMVNRDRELIEERYDFSEDCSVPMTRLIGNQLTLPHFATLFARKDCFKNFDGQFLGTECNDMIIRIMCALQGDIHYINKNMSCYRRFTESSWTVNVGNSHDKFVNHLKQYIPFLKELNLYTNGKYEKDILKSIDRREFEIALLENRYKDAVKKQAYKKSSFKRKIYILIGCICPKLMNRLRK